MAEITRNDIFGAIIIQAVKEFKLAKCLEIGSWDGLGSTQCFIEGMKDLPDRHLDCIEINRDRFKELIYNTYQYKGWVDCYNKSSISYDDMLHKDFNEIWSSPYNKFENTKKETANGWFKGELITILSNDGVITPGMKYDGVLIDGAEFTGYSEFKLLKDNVNVFFLDDYFRAFKTNQVVEELSNDSDWEAVAINPNLRNGFAIFKRKQFV